LEITNMPIVSDVSQLAVTFGSNFGKVDVLLLSSATVLKLQVLTPPSSSVGNVECEIYLRSAGVGSGASFMFTIYASLSPALLSVYPTEGPISGGTAIAVTLSKFPVVTASSQVSALFGTWAVVAASLLSSDADSTVVVFMSVASSSSGSVLVTVYPSGDKDLSRAAVFSFTFTAAPYPSLTYMSLSQGPVSGGTVVLLGVSDLFLGSVADVNVTFGSVNAVVSNIVSSSALFTMLRVVTPVFSGEANVSVIVSPLSSGPSAAVIQSSFVYIDFPVLDHVVPSWGLSTGGMEVVIQISNALTYSYFDFSVVFGHNRGFVLSGSSSGDVITLVVISPSAVAAGTVLVTVSSTRFVDPIEFHYEYVDASQPYVSAVYPTSGAKDGGSVVYVTVSGLSSLLVSGGSGSTSYFVLFGDVVGQVQSAVASFSSADGPTVSFVLTAPAYAFAGTVDLKVFIVSNDARVSATTNFTFFRPCVFSSFCPLVGMLADTAAVLTNPPSDSSCSPAYCKGLVSYSPAVRSQEPSQSTSAGGRTIVLQLTGFPSVASSDDFHVTFAGEAVDLTLMPSVGSDYVSVSFSSPTSLLIVGPVLVFVAYVGGFSSEGFAVSTSHLLTPSIVGNPIITSFYPLTGYVGEEVAVNLWLGNLRALSVQDIHLAIGTQYVAVSSLSQSDTLSAVGFSIPADACTTVCDLDISIDVTDDIGSSGLAGMLNGSRFYVSRD
jgi:hypothetical protein